MSFKESYKKITKSTGYSIFLIIVGVITLVTGLGVIWSVLVGIFAIALGSYNLYKISRKQKPVCEFCGYVALDERELHNHQITCEKKK